MKVQTCFIPIVNWSPENTTLDIGLKLESGSYSLSRYSLDGVSDCLLDGKRELSATALRGFRVEIPKHATCIFVLRRTGH